MDIYHEVGLRIAQLRLENGFSQTDVAKLLSIAQTTYSGYENGNRKIPLEVLSLLSSIFHTSPNFLLTGREASEAVSPRDFRRHLLEGYSKLNTEGRRRAVEYIDDLTQIPKYQSKLNSTESENS